MSQGQDIFSACIQTLLSCIAMNKTECKVCVYLQSYYLYTLYNLSSEYVISCLHFYSSLSDIQTHTSTKIVYNN